MKDAATYNQDLPINNVVTITKEQDANNLPPIEQLPSSLPLLLDDSDSDDEDEIHPEKSEKQIHQYGNDYCIENDPVPVGSDRQLQQHLPIPPPVQDIVPDHYVVENIINHKGTAARPSSMHLFVKWLGYDDKENSWIKSKKRRSIWMFWRINYDYLILMRINH